MYIKFLVVCIITFFGSFCGALVLNNFQILGNVGQWAGTFISALAIYLNVSQRKIKLISHVKKVDPGSWEKEKESIPWAVGGVITNKSQVSVYVKSIDIQFVSYLLRIKLNSYPASPLYYDQKIDCNETLELKKGTTNIQIDNCKKFRAYLVVRLADGSIHKSAHSVVFGAMDFRSNKST